MALKMSSTLPIMTPKEFLLQLPKVHDLARDDTCPVCMEKYAPIKASAPGIVERFFSMVVPREPESINHKLELAVRLPCQHVLGLRCIKRWVSPVEGGQCTCPYCVQKLFKPSRYPVSTHPLWNPLLNILSQHGLTLDRDGLCRWDPTPGPATLSAQDLLDASTLYPKNAALLERHCPPFPRDNKQQTTHRKTAVQHFATARKTRHLQEAILYLQLQTWGVQTLLPLIDHQTQLEPTYPFFRLGKQQEDALIGYWEGEGEGLLRSASETNRSRRSGRDDHRLSREEWEGLRRLGVLPPTRWLDMW